eukprot:scaffold2348_cov341-Prasinococcus_capsulatus_cf.AAC.3
MRRALDRRAQAASAARLLDPRHRGGGAAGAGLRRGRRGVVLGVVLLAVVIRRAREEQGLAVRPGRRRRSLARGAAGARRLTVLLGGGAVALVLVVGAVDQLGLLVADHGGHGEGMRWPGLCRDGQVLAVGVGVVGEVGPALEGILGGGGVIALLVAAVGLGSVAARLPRVPHGLLGELRARGVGLRLRLRLRLGRCPLPALPLAKLLHLPPLALDLRGREGRMAMSMGHCDGGGEEDDLAAAAFLLAVGLHQDGRLDQVPQHRAVAHRKRRRRREGGAGRRTVAGRSAQDALDLLLLLQEAALVVARGGGVAALRMALDHRVLRPLPLARRPLALAALAAVARGVVAVRAPATTTAAVAAVVVHVAAAAALVRGVPLPTRSGGSVGRCRARHEALRGVRGNLRTRRALLGARRQARVGLREWGAAAQGGMEDGCTDGGRRRAPCA